jgi:hypothetical protein
MKPWYQRTLWRALLATAISTLATVKASVGDGLDSAEWVDVIGAALVAFAAWYGIGAIPGSPTEPFLNQGDRPVEVPVPPAVPEVNP